ncbi:PVC-type heme-binding CxxCH protein [Rubinisphaera sp. JC750]|uniref:PVC-type heme-binding CxxCH protein n=1 Tax=Rubinisphaera sp. JC750 TaxID=2898658 RepID=UPI001F02EB0F|nr:PVC-type heme-binding CxxCH protein [Rubinisphaera sp. JC750]
MLSRLLLIITALVPLWTASPAVAHDDHADDVHAGKAIYNSQQPGEDPTSPEASLAAITVPEGFEVSTFAAEPDVAQPVALEFDDRGRVWVVEFYTYAGRGYDGELRDRILILEDTDHDGVHDRRTVFWNQGNRLTSVLPGSHGCWILNEGTLSWLSDADGDDKADGPPQPALDGFDQNQVGHNIVNGLMWGPDGWIYGRHGIQATSLVGAPDAPPSERTQLNCSIWRYHPVSKRFEVVTAGTTNPWGLDYNSVGEFFFTNNVIGHDWHVLPGAHYKRMYGADFNPHFYELIDQHADHYHWDHSASWTDSRDSMGAHGELGGGHSHCGGMIYLGDNWPAKYRDRLFMCNTHGRRINEDIPVRHESGYVLKHGKDFLFANQQWFRGVDLDYGPDGGVYLNDWTDLGECHDNDGVHRTSGRIYKVTWGQPKQNGPKDLTKLSAVDLAKLHTHENEWYVRHARRQLTGRHRAGQDVSAAVAELQKMQPAVNDPVAQLRLIWTLYCLDAFPLEDQLALLNSENEHLRAWGIKLLMNEEQIPAAAQPKLIALAKSESSPFVRVYLASALQKLPSESVWPLAEQLCGYAEDADDHNIPLMLWYGLEPQVASQPQAAAKLLASTQIPLIRTYIARRLMHENEANPEVGPLLVEALLQNKDPEFRRQVLIGMTDATRGWRKTIAPANWAQLAADLEQNPEETLDELARELSVVFGDGRAMEQLQKIIKDRDATPIDRMNAIEIFVASRPDGAAPLLQSLMNDRAIEAAVAAGLAAFDDAKTPNLLLNRYRWFKADARKAAVETLCSRPEYAELLLQAMKDKRYENLDLTAAQARQIASFENPALTAMLEEVWGSLQSTEAEKLERIEQLKHALSDEVLAKADTAHGRLLYNKTCAACHRLFDAGENIGPNLTGSNRDSLDYLLENMIAPSAVVPKQYQTVTVVLASGRVLNGLIASQTERSLVLQTAQEKLTIDRDEVELVKPSTLSLMPEGQLDKMTPEEIRDLIGYLQSRQQVELRRE